MSRAGAAEKAVVKAKATNAEKRRTREKRGKQGARERRGGNVEVNGFNEFSPCSLSISSFIFAPLTRLAPFLSNRNCFITRLFA